ncbi:sugar phosphate isomerase/epimerase family protein [Providencia heimbachae]|uniref:Epimerase n=1 Tax=Providencia heimbachae ATCC 35613 TaxID=1354272 RepID=A0A1B7JWF7_9GAMM|nr:sugar phosphate isomerase/epimerase [Providencia heimbachae]OAT52240.1 epimerase [Providencia heimbachae ATCC 35613]SQH15066.1 Xylose isomerase-like TIM barrel [Providencia heimbachae]
MSKEIISKEIIVVTAAFGANTVKQMGGQQALLDIIHSAKADGVEIRQELLLAGDKLDEISAKLQSRQLSAVYSVPDTLFHEGAPINASKIQRYLDDAKQLKARFLKLSLGDLPKNYDLSAIIEILNAYSVQLVIENDQTEAGGHIEPLKRFFADVSAKKMPIKMAFDMANWYWLNEDPLSAAQYFAPFVAYIHVKTCQSRAGKMAAIALDNSDGSWKKVIQALPADVPRGIEFPLEGDDLRAVTEHYVSLLKEI